MGKSECIKAFFHRIAKDFKQKELLPLKLLFFMHSSTILVLYPYLTIHMRELGINVEETAIMSAVTPAVAILMPPLAGMLADKIGNFRIMLAAFSILGGASALLLLLVPVGRIKLTFPDSVEFGVSCPISSTPMLSLYQEHTCTPIYEDSTFYVDMKLESCGFACQAILDENNTASVMEANSYGVQLYDIESNSTKMYTYTLSEEDHHAAVLISASRNHKVLKNNERYLTSIRKLSKNSFYFPTNLLYNFSCDIGDELVTPCLLGGKDQLSAFKKRLNNPWKSGVHLMKHEEDHALEELQLYKVDYIDSEKNNNLTCIESFTHTGKHVSISIPINENDETAKIKHLDFGSCAPRCVATAPRKQVCSNKNTVVELDMQVTFWSYLVVRVFVGIVSGTSFAMFEGAVIAILREHKADYGLQRIYASMGGMISSPISGWLIDFASRGKSYTDFSPIFFLYAALKIISGILMLFINLEFKKAATSVVKDVIAVLKKLELIALFISCLILGCAWGFIENFLFWLLEDLGGTKSLMGLTITVAGVIGIPLLALSGPIIKKLGHANVIFIGFIFYAIRLMGYSIIYNPWLCLIFEAMESITFGLSFTAAVTYAAKLSNVTTDTSIQGMLGGLYYGVGKGIGSLIGGFLIKVIGIRDTFKIFSGVTAGTGVMYIAFYHLYIKSRAPPSDDITKKDVEKEKPQTFEDVDLKSKEKDIHSNVPAVYEDALVNPAYENTEDNEENITEKINNEKNKTVMNGNI